VSTNTRQVIGVVEMGAGLVSSFRSIWSYSKDFGVSLRSKQLGADILIRPRCCRYTQPLRKKCGLDPNLRLNWREKWVALLKPEARAISVTDIAVSFISA